MNSKYETEDVQGNKKWQKKGSTTSANNGRLIILIACCLYMIVIVTHSSSGIDSREVDMEFRLLEEFKNDDRCINNNNNNCSGPFITSKVIKFSTTKKNNVPPKSALKQKKDQGQDDDADELKFVHENPPKNSPPIYIAVPTVPRHQNIDYLLLAIQYMYDQKFPMENVYIIYNGNPTQTQHYRWNEAEILFSNKGVHFLWNDSPAPKAHPATFNTSLPVPQSLKSYFEWDKKEKKQKRKRKNNNSNTANDNDVNNDHKQIQNITSNFNNMKNKTLTNASASVSEMAANKIYVDKWLSQVLVAQKNDNTSRKNWRRKECYDFRINAQYMLQNVVYKDADIYNYDDVYKRNNSWVIFHQDDATFNKDFRFVWEMLDNEATTNITRYDFFSSGMVSGAFQAKGLLEILDMPRVFCDFLPVDWMVWAFEDFYASGTSKRAPKVVNHVGKVSSKQGRVVE